MPRYLLKKGQLKMFESVAVLILFFFLVVIGLRFYAEFSAAELQEVKDKFTAFDSLKIANTIINMPEISCSTNSIELGSCVDMLKVEAFIASNTPVMRQYKATLLGTSEIVLRQYRPEERTWLLYNRSINSSSRFTPVPVGVFDPIQRRVGFGVLEVRTFESAN